MKRFVFVLVIALVCAQLALAHIRIYPNDSTVGTREKWLESGHDKNQPLIWFGLHN
jgi:hypothetical protein